MNLILFTRQELESGIDAEDPRIRHIREVLRFGKDDWFDMGIENGRRGKARLKSTQDGLARFEVQLGEITPPLFRFTLIVGMPRPQTARRLLREMTSIGLQRLAFAGTDRSEKGYAESKLWTTGEYRRHLRQGTEQAFSTRIPEIGLYASLVEALDATAESGQVRIALDNYEAGMPLSKAAAGPAPAESGETDREILLAVGAERGWSARERDVLRDRGFRLAHLGERVLRVETAAVAAAAIVLSARGAL